MLCQALRVCFARRSVLPHTGVSPPFLFPPRPPLFLGGGRKCQMNGPIPKESFIINHSPPEREHKNVCGKDKAVRKGKGIKIQP